jgi:hypothetical protein
LSIYTFNKLLKSIGDNNEDRVKDLGDQLFDNLLRDKENDKVKVKELIDQLNKVLIPDSETKSKKDADIIKNVWIFCNYSDNDYPWEWIHWKNADLFWGDKFHIVRIPVNYRFEELDFQITLHKVTILIDRFCPSAWKNYHDTKILCNLLKDFVECQEIPLDDSNLTNLNDFNCIHIGADRDTFEKNNEFLAKISAKLFQNKPNFLFLNTYIKEPSGKHYYPSASIYPYPLTTCIDSSLDNIPEKCASHFVICFYNVLKDSLKNNKEATIVETVAKTREIIKNQKELNCDRFWRFAYVINGNPCTTLTHA